MEKNVFTGESVIGMTMTKEDLDDNKVALQVIDLE